MKKIDYGQVMQILANLSVFAGIVFLGLELQQNNELLNQQVRATTLEQRQSVSQLLFENPEVIELLGKDGQALSETDHDRLRLLGLRVLVVMEHNYREAILGLQDIDDLANRTRSLYHRPRLNYGIPTAWTTYRPTADPEFVRWFEENVISLK